MMDLTQLNDQIVLITGATGLIGKTIVKMLLEWNRNNSGTIHIIALVRNEKKAEAIYKDIKTAYLSFLVCDICDIDIKNMNINYIIHGASITSSKMFVNKPVETAMTSILGTRNILELARINPIRSLVFLSSMEVYGSPQVDGKISEEHGTNLDTMSVRSGYPESKRMCENLCASYHEEYGVPSKVVRLTQVFGPGVEYSDSRVFAEFARCVIEERDIILKTKGETKRNYLYTQDAVEAIFTILLKGKNGEAYNAANEEIYCSIYDMAHLVATRCAQGKIKVLIDETDVSQCGYMPILKMNLDTNKLKKLGWLPGTDLEQMYFKMIEDMRFRRGSSEILCGDND